MNSPIVFNAVGPVWMIILFAVVPGIFFIWLESQRKTKAKTVRIIAQIVILIALTGLALQPSYRMETSKKPVMLLTKGYSKKIADSLVSIYPGLVIHRHTNAEIYPESTTVASYGNLEDKGQTLTFVLGEGIPANAIDLNPNLNFTYFSSPEPKGVSELMQESFQVNRRSKLRGKFINGANTTTLKLIGPGGSEDSIQLKTPGEIPFALSFNPRQSGTFVYRLKVTVEKGLSQIENIPLEILPERKMNVLVFQQYPTFEIRYLKNFLEESGHGVVLRYQVSKNRYRYEYGNHEVVSIDHLGVDLLEDFDLLIINQTDVERLNPSERKNLKDAIHSGFGLIILLDKVPDDKSQEPFLSATFTKSASDTVQVPFQSMDRQTIQMFPYQFKSKGATETITMAKDQNILSGYQYVGLGKVGFQLLKETYSMTLRGQADAYSELWTPLIESTARVATTRFRINIRSAFPLYANDPIIVEVISTGEKPTLFVDRAQVSLIEDVVVDDLWHGRLWTDTPGWHKLTIDQDSIIRNFYVSADNDWLSFSKTHQIQENRLHSIAKLSTEEKVYFLKPISVWIWFSMFLIAAIFLWLEPRI